MTQAINIIKKACDRTGIGYRELAESTGIPYSTLYYKRLKPQREGSFRLYELQAIMRHVWIEDSEILQLMRGKK